MNRSEESEERLLQIPFTATAQCPHLRVMLPVARTNLLVTARSPPCLTCWAFRKHVTGLALGGAPTSPRACRDLKQTEKIIESWHYSDTSHPWNQELTHTVQRHMLSAQIYTKDQLIGNAPTSKEGVRGHGTLTHMHDS